MNWKMLFEEYQNVVLISEWNGLIYSGSPCSIMNPYIFLRKLICGWKKLFEKFKVGCLVQDHLLNLSSMKEAVFETHPTKFLLMKTYGSEEDVV